MSEEPITPVEETESTEPVETNIQEEQSVTDTESKAEESVPETPTDQGPTLESDIDHNLDNRTRSIEQLRTNSQIVIDKLAKFIDVQADQLSKDKEHPGDISAMQNNLGELKDCEGRVAALLSVLPVS